MKRAIAWFARNGVAANLLLLVIVAGGALSIGAIRKEVFPEFSPDMITVSVRYRGAAPEEVEEGICTRIEEAVQGLDGVKRVRSTANEGMGAVTIEVLPEADTRKVLDDVKTQVDAIETFPVEAEKPIVQEVSMRRQVISVAVSGDADLRTLKRLAERVRDEITLLPGITLAELAVAPPYEISIEVSEETLRRYGMTFDEVALAVRSSSLDIPAGSIKTDAGEHMLRVKGQAYHGREFERLPLRTLPDGSRILLGDVAKVVDGFEDTDQRAFFNGKPCVVVHVFRVGDQSALAISKAVRAYVAEAQARMPQGVRLTAFGDYAQYLRSRLNLLLKNAGYGFVLVFALLGLFLRLRLAVWVSVGIPVSFLGTLWLMPELDASINMLSLFAFLLVLGIVVDDAIVVGENVYTHFQSGKHGVEAAIHGAQEVSAPVIFSVLTTVAAFVPLLLVEGNMGKVMRGIPLIVIPTLLFSLTESMLCVPNHLSHMRLETASEERRHPLRRLQRTFARGLERFVQTRFRAFLSSCLERRYLTASVALATLVVAAGLVAGGWVRFQFFPPAEGDALAAYLTMPEGTSALSTARAVQQIERAALETEREFRRKDVTSNGQPLFEHVLASVADQPYRSATQHVPIGSRASFASPNLGEVQIQLAPAEVRRVSAQKILDRWRELTGPVPGAQEVIFTSALFSAGDAINVQLTGPDLTDLKQAAEELKAGLRNYRGVRDVADSYRAGKPEIKIRIKPEGEALGLTLAALGRQIRQAFYGEEAQRIQRGRDDVRVMVRYPLEARRALDSLAEMRIRLPDGAEAPFDAVAEAHYGRGYSTITRVDRRRAVNVTADVDVEETTTDEVLNGLLQKELPELLARHPNIRYSFEGQSREQSDTLKSLMRGFLLALFMIYALIAVPLKSYIHPAVVMSAIPFGFFGALLGHLLLGFHLTILSLFGLVALAGVAVNDGLVLVDFINRARRGGAPLAAAVREAAVRRFRPVLLTSLTTFAGVMPLIMEKSIQARFLIPMAISLGFGVLYCTLTTLLLVPASYLILEDLRRVLQRLTGWSLEPNWGEDAENNPLALE